ncbi:hypothetical protein IR009_14115 [Pseudomonas putida]|uniref:hypothetical protein n=1 Tax=Pseudomonas putida TaxID=303 RepID=UPI0018A970B4|nr:hypothetical protein [Pseudomonas putida]MBF8766353.1 hypothetical protein [Pseudomonas putida]
MNDKTPNEQETTGRVYGCAITAAVIDAIKDYKSRDWPNRGGFSVAVDLVDGDYYARCSFFNDEDMTIMYRENTETELVASIYDLTNLREISRLAKLMENEEWLNVVSND